MTLSWLGTSAVSLQESNAAMLPAKGIAELPLTRALLRDFSFLLANLLYACEPNEYKYLWDILSQWDEGETFADASKCTGHGSLRRFLVACFKGEGSWIRSLKTQAGVAWLEKTFLFLRGRSYDGHTILNLDVQVLARLLISDPDLRDQLDAHAAVFLCMLCILQTLKCLQSVAIGCIWFPSRGGSSVMFKSVP